MGRFTEKLIIISFCLYNTYKINISMDLVPYFLLSLIISFALDLFNDKKHRAIIYLLFILISISNSLFILFLPLILYNIYLDFGIYAFFTLPLLLLDFSGLNALIYIISIYLANSSKEFTTISEKNKVARDKLKEDTLFLKRYTDHLKLDEEKNIQIAILTERNRIARELHDSIGHSISSSILQVEALKVTSINNNMEGLNLLQQTLDNGMNDIRNSIHNLYNESFDLEGKIEKLCSEISTIETQLYYKIEDDLSYDLKFDIFSIVKEGVTNCIKHSNATELRINLLNQPKFYSVIIKDNGSKFDQDSPISTKGMGLMSMNEIANKYDGFLNYGFDQGFKIHLTLMKG